MNEKFYHFNKCILPTIWINGSWDELHLGEVPWQDADPWICCWLASPDLACGWLDGVVACRNECPGRRIKCTGYNFLLSRLQGSTTIFNNFREALLVFTLGITLNKREINFQVFIWSAQFGTISWTKVIFELHELCWHV